MTLLLTESLVDVIPTKLPGLVLVAPKVYQDDRGFLLETYQARRYESCGISGPFVQDNHSYSGPNVIRGLHHQQPTATSAGQAKLVHCTRGAIWDVAVDLRQESPTFGRWEACELSAENHRQLFIPVGFAHGFAVVSQGAEVMYKCGDYYDPQAEVGLAYDDPDLAIPWPLTDPVLSERDRRNPGFAEYRARPVF